MDFCPTISFPRRHLRLKQEGEVGLTLKNSQKSKVEVFRITQNVCFYIYNVCVCMFKNNSFASIVPLYHTLPHQAQDQTHHHEAQEAQLLALSESQPAMASRKVTETKHLHWITVSYLIKEDCVVYSLFLSALLAGKPVEMRLYTLASDAAAKTVDIIRQ